MTAPRPTSATLSVPVRAESGVRCTECVGRVCAEIEALPGVSHVECDPRGTMRVEFDASRVSVEELEESASRFGIELGGVYEHAVWRVTGLD